MSEHDSKSEEERIQAMLQQSSDQWDEQQDQLPSNSNASPKQHMRSPQPFPNPMMNAPPGFNPMMNFAMLNPQLQFQQMMMQQQMQQMHQPRQAMGQSNIPPETQKPPVGYVCFKCRQPGHWIYYCPNVPKGQFVPRPDMNGSQQAQQHDASSAKQKPSELTCRICGKLMKDAVLVPCCGKSFCKECITTKLDETSKCPVCNKEDVRSSQVIPNRSLRNTIQAYQEQSDKEAEAAAAEAANVQPAEEPAEDRQQQQQQQQQPIKDEPMVTDNDPRSMVHGNNKGGLPIQVFESEERTPRKQKHEGGMPETMGGPQFGGNGMMMGGPPNDMGWMMGMPPGMNPAAAAAMMQMRMGADNWGFGMGEGMGPDFGGEMDMAMSGPGGTGMPRPPFMNPGGFPGGFPGAPEEMWGGPFPGMPPQDMMQFGGGGGPMGGFNPRGGFGGGGRGRGRGGKPFTTPGRRRSTDGDNKRDEEELSTEQKGVDMAGPDEAIPTAPRAERERYAHQNRYRSSSSRHHRRSSRSPSRSRSPTRREEYRRRASRSRSRSPSKSKRRASRSRSPSKSRSAAVNQTEERLPTSPRSHRERRSHRSSRHHSSRYRSRERDRDRDREREREKDRSRDRSKRRERR